MMLFSIIIPTYNRGAYISNTLSSALNQSRDNFEIIVVDDGSTDNTEEIVKSFPDPRIRYYKKQNGERGAARNYGTTKAKGDYLTFLDSDDELLPHFIEEAEKMATAVNPVFFHLGYEIKNTATGKTTRYPLKESINEDLIRGNYLSCIGVFIRKDIALQNRFNEDRALSGLEDWELWLRLAAQYKLHYTNKICARLIDHNERSVVNVDIDKLIARHELFIKIVTANPLLIDKYGRSFRQFISANYSYIALHIALAKTQKGKSVSYLWKSLKLNPPGFLSRRTLAILKHLVI